MAACPAGHESSTTDYCDTCGTLMTPSAPAPEPPAEVSAEEPLKRCPYCNEPLTGRFCEVDGYDSELPVPGSAPTAQPSAQPTAQPTEKPTPPAVQPSPPAGWTVVARADRAWFEEVRRRDGPDAASVEFPLYAPERRFALSGQQMTIGRRSVSRGIYPEIDLSGKPLDPGVSTLHALLQAGPDGGWTITDMDSTNGTTVGDGPDPIPPRTPVPLPDGSLIRIGAWTVLTVHAP